MNPLAVPLKLAGRYAQSRARGFPGVNGTSAGEQVLGMFDSCAGLGARGAPIGEVVSGGRTGHNYDPFELYPERLTDPNMIIWGKLGYRKSTAVKVYLRRQWCFGRRIWIIDPKREYHPLVADLDGALITMRRGGGVRLNPLASPANRHPLLRSITRAVLPRELSEKEPALLNTALDEAVALNAEPILPDVLKLLFAPTGQMAAKVSATVREFRREARSLAMALQPLCEGDLRGMVDGPTTAGLDLRAQVVCVDLRDMIDSQALAILMACTMASIQAEIIRQAEEHKALNEQHRRHGQPQTPAPKSILVLDEAWRAFSVPGCGEWFQSQFKLSRDSGTQNILVMHRPSDLRATGDDGSRMMKLALGLIEDCQTFVVFRLDGRELDAAQEILGLTDTEKAIIATLPPGQALWKVGRDRWVVQTTTSASDRVLIDTDAAMK